MNTIDLIQTVFPGLRDCQWEVTSTPSRRYNCIAWAVGLTKGWWWPSNKSDWPDGVAREWTIEAFVAAFATKGFVACDHDHLEEGFEKIALYAMANRPTHAARQLPSGLWTSKLGNNHDITHATLEGVSGSVYGTAILLFKRPQPQQP